MALLSKTNITTLQYSADGSPFCHVATKSSINLDTIEYSSDGSPWYGVEDVTVTDVIKKVSNQTWNTIKKIGGIILANIKKIGGIST